MIEKMKGIMELIILINVVELMGYFLLHSAYSFTDNAVLFFVIYLTFHLGQKGENQ